MPSAERSALFLEKNLRLNSLTTRYARRKAGRVLALIVLEKARRRSRLEVDIAFSRFCEGSQVIVKMLQGSCAASEFARESQPLLSVQHAFYDYLAYISLHREEGLPQSTL